MDSSHDLDVAAQGPVTRIPPELVGEIVLHTLGFYEPPGMPAVSFDTTTGPWVYSQVCRSWRQEILSRPFIWHNISLDLTYWPHDNSRVSPSLDAFKAVLHRSSDHPLDLQIGATPVTDASDSDDDPCDPDSEFEYEHWAGSFLSLAMEHCARWRRVSLSISASLLSLLQSVQGRLHNLERLSIQTGDMTLLPTTSLSSTPKLQRLSLSNDACQCYKLPTLNLPWNQITHFKCKSRDWSPLDFTMLNFMPNLLYFHLSGFGIDWDLMESNNFEDITHTKLRSLGGYHFEPSPHDNDSRDRYWGEEEEEFPSVLTYLTLPALEEIRISNDIDLSSLVCPARHRPDRSSFISRSPALSTITLHDHYVRGNPIGLERCASILSHEEFAQITTLRLTMNRPDLLLLHLEKCLRTLPRLEILKIGISRLETDGFAKLASSIHNFLKSRIRSKTFRELWLVWDDRAAWERARKLAKEIEALGSGAVLKVEFGEHNVYSSGVEFGFTE